MGATATTTARSRSRAVCIHASLHKMQLLSKLLHLNKLTGAPGDNCATVGFLIIQETHASFIIQPPPAPPLRAWRSFHSRSPARRTFPVQPPRPVPSAPPSPPPPREHGPPAPQEIRNTFHVHYTNCTLYTYLTIFIVLFSSAALVQLVREIKPQSISLFYFAGVIQYLMSRCYSTISLQLYYPLNTYNLKILINVENRSMLNSTLENILCVKKVMVVNQF